MCVCVCGAVIACLSLLSAQLPSLVINVSEMPFDNEAAVFLSFFLSIILFFFLHPFRNINLHITVAGAFSIEMRLGFNN